MPPHFRDGHYITVVKVFLQSHLEEFYFKDTYFIKEISIMAPRTKLNRTANEEGRLNDIRKLREANREEVRRHQQLRTSVAGPHSLEAQWFSMLDITQQYEKQTDELMASEILNGRELPLPLKSNPTIHSIGDEHRKSLEQLPARPSQLYEKVVAEKKVPYQPAKPEVYLLLETRYQQLSSKNKSAMFHLCQEHICSQDQKQEAAFHSLHCNLLMMLEHL